MVLGVILGKMQFKRAKKNPTDASNVPLFCFYCTEGLDLHKSSIKQEVSATSLPGYKLGNTVSIYLSFNSQLCLKFLEVMGFHGRMLL